MGVATNSDPKIPKTEHAVVIAGSGPTGLMLAAELALTGVDGAVHNYFLALWQTHIERILADWYVNLRCPPIGGVR